MTPVGDRSRLLQFVRWLDAGVMSPWFLSLTVAVGILLRLIQYLHNRSLWADEAALTANILNRDYSGLLQILDWHQGAPVGFLFGERALIALFGNSEYVLRLIPLLAGIGAIFVFYMVARRSLSERAVPLAMLLFVLSDRLIYYASEVKQYSSDVFVVLLIVASAMYWVDAEAPLTRLRWIAAALGGAVLIWFGHPAVFALAGIGLTLFVCSLTGHKPETTRRLVGIGIVWGLSFGLNYYVSLRNLTSDSYLLSFWSSGFMPLPPKSLGELRWFIDTFFFPLQDPMMFSITSVAVVALALVTGGYTLYRQQRIVFFILTVPLLVTLLASALQLFPYRGRLILFVVPFYLLFIAEGTEQVLKMFWNASPDSPQHRSAAIVASIAFLILLLSSPINDAMATVSRPLEPMPGSSLGLEDIRPVAQYVAENRQQDDIIYVYQSSIAPLSYYAERFRLDPDQFYVGGSHRSDWQGYYDEIDSLLGNERVWFVFSHIFHSKADEQALFEFYLDRIGRQLDTFTADGAAAYLYDLSE